jgi:CheY-like chemotaxis protein
MPASRPLHVLLAEDEPVNQELTICVLRDHGHSVVVAPNGPAAVDAWDRETFDVVLMDVQMPGMDGFEATAEIRRREDGHRAAGGAALRILRSSP